MDKANMIHNKDLLHAINYIINLKYYCYQMKPDVNLNEPWELCGYSDEDFSGNNDTRKSVTRCIVLTNGLVIA